MGIAGFSSQPEVTIGITNTKMNSATKDTIYTSEELALEQSNDMGSSKELHDAKLPEEGLHKTLKDRHLSMIALGGSLGTGLLIGTGSALVKAGPAGTLIDYSIVGIVVFLVMAALGEMTSFAPMSHGFGGYASRFVDPALGFATGYAYLFKYLLATPNQMAAASLIMKFWFGDRVSPAVWISIMLLIVLAVNFASVKAFGEFEFWLSSLKVIILVGVILLMFIIAVGGGPTGEVLGFRYWSNPGAFAEYKLHGDAGRFVGVWSTMIQAVYAFGGTELVGVTVAEAKNPRIAMPKAVKMTFFRICFFYVLSVFFLGMCVPYNSPELVFAAKSSASAAASPFVVAITLAKIQGLDHVVNACLLVFVISAATSDFYTSTRTLYGIARDAKAPQIFARANQRGVPYVAMTVSAAFCCLAYMSVQSGAKLVFGYLTNMVTVFGLLTWISILTTHVGFCKAVKAQNVPSENFAYRSPFGIVGSYIALIFLSILILTKSFDVFLIKFDAKLFIVGYIGLPVYLLCLFGWKFLKQTSRVKAQDADLKTGVPEESIHEEKARLQAQKQEEISQASGPKGALMRVYRKGFSWLF